MDPWPLTQAVWLGASSCAVSELTPAVMGVVGMLSQNVPVGVALLDSGAVQSLLWFLLGSGWYQGCHAILCHRKWQCPIDQA